MKKMLMALLCAFPLASQAFLSSDTDTNVDWYHDFSLSINEFSVSHDQKGDWGLDETQLGWNGFRITTSDVLDFGVGYETIFPVSVGESDFLFGSAVWFHDDIILELSTVSLLGGLRVEPMIQWNVSDAHIDAEVELGYVLGGVNVDTTLFYDLEGLDYTGSQFELGYRFTVNENISVTPNLTVPFDEDWEEGDVWAGLSVNVAFSVPKSTVTN